MVRAFWKPKLNFLNIPKTFYKSAFIRSFEVLPEHVNHIVTIHNGKRKKKVMLNKCMIGFKIGSLFLSKSHKKVISKKKLKTKKKK